MARRTKHPLSRAECRWRRIIAEWRESGLSAPEFCDGKTFTAKTLYVWSSKLNKIDADLAKSGELVPPVFLPVEIIDQAETDDLEVEPEPIEVHLARGDVIRIPRGCDMQQLSQIVAILRGDWQ